MSLVLLGCLRLALVSRKQIARVDFVGNLFGFAFEAVGDNDIAALGELREAVLGLEAIEIAAVGKGWFVDNNLYAFTAKIFNNILNGG